MIIERIIQDNTPLMKECYKNQDICDDNGYLMFLNEHLLGSIIYTMTSEDLDSFHQHLYDTYTTSLIYNDDKVDNNELEEEEEEEERILTTERIRKEYNFSSDENNMMEIEDYENFDSFNIPPAEIIPKRVVPVKAIPKAIFGCLRYFVYII